MLGGGEHCLPAWKLLMVVDELDMNSGGWGTSLEQMQCSNYGQYDWLCETGGLGGILMGGTERY